AEQQQHLAALPPFRLESHSTDGKVVYTYADPDGCHCLYVGGSKEYSKFQRLKASQIDGDIWGGPWRSGSAFPSARETGLPDLVISRTHGLEAMAPEEDRMRRVLEKSFLIMMVVAASPRWESRPRLTSPTSSPRSRSRVARGASSKPRWEPPSMTCSSTRSPSCP